MSGAPSGGWTGVIQDDLRRLLAEAEAERDEARRIAAALEGELARILDAWDAILTAPGADSSHALMLAIAAAREWVGTEARP